VSAGRRGAEEKGCRERTDETGGDLTYRVAATVDFGNRLYQEKEPKPRKNPLGKSECPPMVFVFLAILDLVLRRDHPEKKGLKVSSGSYFGFSHLLGREDTVPTSGSPFPVLAALGLRRSGGGGANRRRGKKPQKTPLPTFPTLHKRLQGD